MDIPEDISLSRLEMCTYRYLQQMAKSMSLPCNVKKVYLIEMIRAKNYCSAEDLDAIIRRIREERKQLAQTRKPTKRRKKRVQGKEISSTSTSPPISLTRRSSSDFVTHSPNSRQVIMKYQPRSNILQHTITKRNESDRVLRSSHRMRPDYSFLNISNSVIGVIKAKNALQQAQDIEERQYQLSVAFQRPITVGDCVVRQRSIDYGYVQRRPVKFDGGNEERQLVPVARSSNISPPSLAKPERRLSGIYPLKPLEGPYCQYIPSVGFRRQDPCLSKINAIQKCLAKRESIERKSLLRTYDRPSPIRCQSRVIVPKPRTVQANLIPNVNLRHILNYDIDQPPLSNPSTESVRESSLEREHNENIQTNVSGNSNKCTDNSNDAKNVTDIFAVVHVDRDTQTDPPIETPSVEIDYPNMSALTDIYPENQVTELASNKPNNFSVYYHKKIRAERVRSQKTYTDTDPGIEERLPRITDVFSRFNDDQYKNLTQPLYVQVSDEAERISPSRLNNNASTLNNNTSTLNNNTSTLNNNTSTLNTTKFDNTAMLNNTLLDNNILMLNNNTSIVNNNTTMLESFFNFKREFITGQPLEPMPASTDTKCTFCTSTITTAVALPTAAVREEYITQSYERPSQYNVEAESAPRLYDYLRMAEQERKDVQCDEVLSSSSSSFGTPLPPSPSSKVPGANSTIPEMVEDALELISQDGDYMERIGMDVRMQCILCDWAGPKIMLEYHIRKEHSSEILHQSTPDWVISFGVGALLRSGGGGGDGGGWGRLVLYNSRVFVLSARCAADCFLANLTLLPSVSDEDPKYTRLTVYNKVTGEPFTWEGPIPDLPDDIHTDIHALKLDISSLDLLPNSANLKLVNGELVTNSVAKVFVGHPELDSIEISVCVKVFD